MGVWFLFDGLIVAPVVGFSLLIRLVSFAFSFPGSERSHRLVVSGLLAMYIGTLTPPCGLDGAFCCVPLDPEWLKFL